MNVWILLLFVENILYFYNFSIGSIFENYLYKILFCSLFYNDIFKEVVEFLLKDL